ncbi:hypothetical protein M569_07620 [Genlisea aurea]|uniref:Uncharacterized protein n=1 Tax=Genlisea aurea TaxID=192259 RepID=S8DVE3_9LAMI|nr:hypothetical protein M569_07620 [Genlisea aurea]
MPQDQKTHAAHISCSEVHHQFLCFFRSSDADMRRDMIRGEVNRSGIDSPDRNF